MNTEYYAVVLNPNTPFQYFNDVAKVKAIASVTFEEPMPTSPNDVYDIIMQAAIKIYGRVAVSIGVKPLNLDAFEYELNKADYHINAEVKYPIGRLCPEETIEVHSRWNKGQGILVRVYPTQGPDNADTLTLQSVCSLSEYDIKNHSFIKIREY